MKSKTTLKFSTKEERAEATKRWSEFESKFKASTELEHEDFSDYMHQSTTVLSAPVQDELTSVMRELKAIADNATKYLQFALGRHGCRTFFTAAADPFDWLTTITSFKTVKYATETEANAAGAALYWPGGGTVVSEYRTRKNQGFAYALNPDWEVAPAWRALSEQLLQRFATWKDVVDEIAPQSDEGRSHCYGWSIAIAKKNATFMNKISQVKVALPQIAMSLQNWAHALAENLIDEEIYEGIFCGDTGDEYRSSD